jgi:bifunctional non-homologous end joining protein LigD
MRTASPSRNHKGNLALTAMPEDRTQPYRRKRNFAVTQEPRGDAPAAASGALFVVQKHAARRAGLHWDFRLEHGGVLWSWAVPKGPSLDPADKRLAIHVEDHPVDYAAFQGDIPAGQYGGGAVETWDRGTWQPLDDPDAGMRQGELKFILHGARLNGRFTLVRLRNRDHGKQEAWFLIKGHDEAAQQGGTAPALERRGMLVSPPPPIPPHKVEESTVLLPPPRGEGRGRGKIPPAKGALRGVIPSNQGPQLCALVAQAPDGSGWLSEIKFDGYRLLAWVNNGAVRLTTRNGHDWTDRLPVVAKAVAQLNVKNAVLDGELVALRPDGSSSFSDLQAALSAGADRKLVFYAFDLLALDGWDLRPCRLIGRKRALEGLSDWTGLLRYSAHVADDAAQMHRHACGLHLEGIVCKKADAPYRGGRGHGWVKVKCVGREELVVLGWTPPAGSRVGIGALHVGYFDADGKLHYAGGVGTGFSDRELAALRKRLDPLKSPPPAGMLVAGDPLDPAITWVRPELVAEIQYAAWSGAGRVRHAVYLGLREDKAAQQVVRAVADPAVPRAAFTPHGPRRAIVRSKAAVPPVRAAAHAIASNRIVVARKPKQAAAKLEGVDLTHPDRELWPGITKRDLAEYWLAIADTALAGIAHRPLSVVRCPDGIAGEHFFQKNGHGHMPPSIRDGSVSGQPYLAIDDASGLVAMTQMSAIELHTWGASEADPLHPDRLVFDLDPGEGVAFPDVIAAAQEVRERLAALNLESFCRTTGGKGLHVVVPLTAAADWTQAKAFCHAFAETMAQDAPDKYLTHVKIADRRGRILIDWLRNGLGATAVASFCPRARPGAGVATPLAWREVTNKLDPAAHTLRTVPARLAKLKADPWAGFASLKQTLPDLTPGHPAEKSSAAGMKPNAGSRVVVARKPGPRRK